MKIGQLKKSLTRFNSDMDDCEIMISFMDGKIESFDSLAYVAYTEIADDTYVVLGTLGFATDRVKKNTLKMADGSSPNTDGFTITE